MPRVSTTKARTVKTTTRAITARKPAVKKTTSKTAARKTPVRKVAARKPAVRRTKKPTIQVTPVKYTFTKATLAQELAERTDTDTKTAKSYLKAIEDLFLGTVHPKGAGTFSIPGVLKVVTRKTKATKGGVTKKSPFTGEMYKTKAKPASVKVRVRAGSKLKQAALL